MERILFIGDRFDDFGGEGREKEKKELSLRRKKRRERDIDESGGLSKSRLHWYSNQFHHNRSLASPKPPARAERFHA